MDNIERIEGISEVIEIHPNAKYVAIVKDAYKDKIYEIGRQFEEFMRSDSTIMFVPESDIILHKVLDESDAPE